MSEKTIIRQFIIDNFLFGNDEGLLDTDLLRQKGIIDSTGVLELIAFVEKTFSLTIDDLEIIPENLDTIERIALFVQTKKSGGEVYTLDSANMGAINMATINTATLKTAGVAVPE